MSNFEYSGSNHDRITSSRSDNGACEVILIEMCRVLTRVLGKPVDHIVCRPYTDMKAGVTFLYVPLSLLSEEMAQTLRAEDGFTFHRRSHSEIWSVRYVLYLTREGRFQPGEKDVIVRKVTQRAEGSLRTFYSADYGTAHFGTVTVTSPVRVSVF